MSNAPSLDDLRLVATIVRTGSVGSAARVLQVAQPSASQRLARLERRTGLTLFDRDTTGTRPTPAGLEMARQADHILDHLDGVLAAARAAGAAALLRVGTFPSLDAPLFPILDDLFREPGIEQLTEHGHRLIEWLAEGTLDAAVVGIADQLVLPTGLISTPIGRDLLVAFLPAGARRPRGTRQPFRDTDVVYGTYDFGGDLLHARLATLGARPRRAATIPTALAIARRRGHPAVLPRSAVVANLADGERVVELPFATRIQLSLVTRVDPDPRLLAVVPDLKAELGLT